MTAGPLAVLAHAATISPELGRQAEARLTRCELSAVATAQPAGYSHDVVSNAHEGQRTITVISTCSAHAVRAYLDRASLNGLVGLVIGRADSVPHVIAERDLISRALSALSADPATCALVAESGNILDSADRYKVATIAYAHTLAARDSMSAHADTAIVSLADIALGLRAHPLLS
jgi:beta-phosphoglucomutase-like phosphatase (HAD superfamily)